MTRNPHRDLCAQMSGIFEAYLENAKNHPDLDEHTVEVLTEKFIEYHGKTGAETPTPDLE